MHDGVVGMADMKLEEGLTCHLGTTPKSKKKKNKKKGVGGGGAEPEETVDMNGDHEESNVEDRDEDADEEEHNVRHTPLSTYTAGRRNGGLMLTRSQTSAAQSHDSDDDVPEDNHPLSPTAQTNGNKSHSISSAVALGLARSRSQGGMSPSPPSSSDTTERLEALSKERDTLRQEVTELRKSLEGIQEKHEDEINNLQTELEETNESKDHFETQYKNLLGRVNTIKTSLGDRLKADAAKLEECHAQINDLEEQNRELQENNNTLTEELAQIRQENEAQTTEITNLRSRASTSQQNWIKERDELISREAYAKEEFENAKQAMQDWEVLAMNERSLRESIAEREAELKDQLESQKEAYERAASERDTNSETVEGLRKALQAVQTGKRSVTALSIHILTNYRMESRAPKTRRRAQLRTLRPPKEGRRSREVRSRLESYP
jgi:predicted  nucleic acid-binding Zn-ribbon protein